MATLNLETTAEAPVIKSAEAAGCGVLVKKVLSGGHGSIDSLRYVGQHAGVCSMIVGTINPDHLKENVRILASKE